MQKYVSSFLRIVPALLLVGLASSAPAETVDELLARLEKKEGELKTWSFTANNTMKSPFMSMESVMKQTMEKGDGGIVKMRLEVDGKMKMMGSEEAQEMKSITVSDGEFMWSESKGMGQHQVVKMAAEKTAQTQYGQLRDAIKDPNTKAEVTGTEEVNGETCTVLKMTKTEGEQTTTITNWLSDKSGVLLKMTMSGAQMGDMTLNVTEYKVNGPIDASAFKYTAPEGVQVQDMTAMKAQMDEAKKAAESAPADAAVSAEPAAATEGGK